MTTSEHIRVAIIGCGLISTEWDLSAPVDAPTLTHVRAFRQHRRALLRVLCDRVGKRVRSAAQDLHVAHAYTDPRQLFEEQSIDVAVIAASSTARWAVIEPVLAAGVKVLVIEKPLASILEESRQLASAINAAEARPIINFSRCSNLSLGALREQISAGDMGALQRLGRHLRQRHCQ